MIERAEQAGRLACTAPSPSRPLADAAGPTTRQGSSRKVHNPSHG
jgi:hypothetical protein